MKKQLLLLFSLVVMFSQAQAIDLFGTYQKALAYNADYLSAIALNQAGQEQQNIARAALLPQIAATGSLTENYFNQGGVQAYYHQPIYSASLNQVVFDFSKFSAYTKGKFATQLSDLQLLNAQQQLMVNVAQAYFDVLYAEDTLLATRMTKEALKQQKEALEAAAQAKIEEILKNNAAKGGR